MPDSPTRRMFLMGAATLPLTGITHARAQEVEATPAETASMPMAGVNPGRTNAMPGPGPVATPEIQWTWEQSGGLYEPPIVIEGVIYVGGDGGELHALDLATGAERWTVAPGDEIASAPAVDNGAMAVETSEGTLTSLRINTGEVRWQFSADSAISSDPMILDDVITIGTNDGVVHSIRAGSGSERWHVDTNLTTLSTAAGPEKSVVVYSAEGTALALSATNGEERWRVNLGAQGGYHLAVANGRVFVSTYIYGGLGALYALDANDGSVLWQVPGMPVSGLLALAEGKVFAGRSVDTAGGDSGEGSIRAFDESTGAQIWQSDLGYLHSSRSGVAWCDGVVYCTDEYSGTLHALDSQTGAENWQIPIYDSLRGGMTIIGGKVLLTHYYGKLFCVGNGEQK